MCLNLVAAVTEWNRNSISKFHRHYFCFKVLFCKYVGTGKILIENCCAPIFLMILRCQLCNTF